MNCRTKSSRTSQRFPVGKGVKKNYRNVRLISRHYLTVTRCSLFQSCFVALMVAIYCDVSSMRFLQDFVVVGFLIRSFLSLILIVFSKHLLTISLCFLKEQVIDTRFAIFGWSDQFHFPFIFCRKNGHRFIMMVLESNYAKLKRNLFLL